MKFKAFLALLIFVITSVRAEMHHHRVDQNQIIENSYVWEVKQSPPFDELLISWNSKRPLHGHYSFYVSVYTEAWSPWLLYAQWGAHFQRGFISQKTDNGVQVYQAAVGTLQEKKGNGFRVKVVAKNGADLSFLRSLHLCRSDIESIAYAKISPPSSFSLPVEGLSQMALKDTRSERLCSPAATAAVVRFLTNDNRVDPILFAERCWDSHFDIFGHWIFNVAEANNQMQGSYCAYVERHQNFMGILCNLEKGFPSVISIRGPLIESASPYNNGHLIAVIGFDHKSNEVICMDPAFETDALTIVRYPLDDLLRAWERRKNMAYTFSQQ